MRYIFLGDFQHISITSGYLCQQNCARRVGYAGNNMTASLRWVHHKKCREGKASLHFFGMIGEVPSTDRKPVRVYDDVQRSEFDGDKLVKPAHERLERINAKCRYFEYSDSYGTDNNAAKRHDDSFRNYFHIDFPRLEAYAAVPFLQRSLIIQAELTYRNRHGGSAQAADPC